MAPYMKTNPKKIKKSKKEAPKLMKKMNSLKTSKKKATPKSLSPILYSKKLVATQGMFFHLEKELKLEIKSTEKRLNSKFHKIDARFAFIDARFNQMEARFSEIDARFNAIESKIDKVLAEVHRMAVLMEEQNARNRFVLEGYDQLYKRQDRLEIEVDRRLKNIEELIITKKEV